MNIEFKKFIYSKYPHQLKNVAKGSLLAQTQDAIAFL